MKLDLKELLQRGIVNTSFSPITYFYKFFYNLSIALAVVFLRQARGVVTIYLRRGAATDEIVYGLSDIDLLVLIREEETEQENLLNKGRVSSIYQRLSQIIPLLGNVHRELGIYTTTEFFKLYRDHDFYAFRFHRGKAMWKLLYGEDLVQSLPPAEENTLRLQSTEELKVWWDFLIVELSEVRYPRFKRRYLWYKAISEAAKIYFYAAHVRTIQSRALALSEIKHHLPSAYQGYLDKITAYPKHWDARENLSANEVLDLYSTLVNTIHSELTGSAHPDGKKISVTLNIPGNDDVIITPATVKALKEFNRNVKSELLPYLDSVVLLPQIEFSTDILDNSDIDSFYLVLNANSYIPVETLKKVHAQFGQCLSPQNIEPFLVMNKSTAFSLQADRPRYCIKSLTTSPLFFALLSKSQPISFDEPFSKQPARILCHLPYNTLETLLTVRAEQIDRTIADRNVYKMKTADFLRFFWAAARTKLLLLSLKSDEIAIPLTSQQILDMLIASYPGDSQWLERLNAEYRKELVGEENESYRFFADAIRLLRCIIQH